MNYEEISLQNNTSELVFSPVTNWNEWDLFLQTSKQRSIFLTSAYLRTCGLESAARYLVVDDRVVGGIVVPELFLETQKDSIRNFSTYQSIWFLPNRSSLLRQSQGQIDLLTRVGKFLSTNQQGLDLSLHWSIEDVRGLHWAFFDNERKEIQFIPRYTGILDLTSFANFEGYIQSLTSGRKADFKKADSLIVSRQLDDSQIPSFMKMYKETVVFDDIESQSTALKQVEHIIRCSVEAKTGSLWLAKDKNGGNLSGVFVQEYESELYYQFGASNKHNLKLSPNAVILMRIIENAMERGFEDFDLVGMNSPKRGAFKASLNPKSTLYFQVLIR